MSVRTDLAVELSENITEGIEKSERQTEYVKITDIKIINETGERLLGKAKGEYITLEFPALYKIADFEPLKKEIINALNKVSPQKRERVLVSGLGNTDITPDAVGPVTVHGILATRHIAGTFAENIGLKGLKSVSVICTGVLGQTGIETGELIKATVDKIKPDAVIAVDALASKSTDRLYRTVQLSNTGISPGSGVKNSRKELSLNTLGVPIIAVGVPTVVDAKTLAEELTGNKASDGEDLFVTPKEVDLLNGKIGEVLRDSLNRFLQPEIDEEVLRSLV